MSDYTKPQPYPVRAEDAEEVFPHVYYAVRVIDDPLSPLVLADFKARDAAGHETYGGPLVTEDGRDALVDLYQEKLDSTVYAYKLLLKGGLSVRDQNTIGDIRKQDLDAVYTLRRLLFERDGK